MKTPSYKQVEANLTAKTSISINSLDIFGVNQLLESIFKIIKLLCQVPPQEWICKEIQDIGNMEFRFAEEQPQDDYAVELA
ncbi:hypothetical protein UlMin_044263, partial [Ulmus minor]